MSKSKWWGTRLTRRARSSSQGYDPPQSFQTIKFTAPPSTTNLTQTTQPTQATPFTVFYMAASSPARRLPTLREERTPSERVE